jgi:hypothetical protein
LKDLAMRAKTFRILGWLFVAGCAAFLVALALEGEWHAARGHSLFHQKRFGEASHHLAKVTDRATLYGWMRSAQFRRYHAQALLASGRTPEAIEQYSILARQHPEDATSHFVVALHEWGSGMRSEATDRLGTIVSHTGSCTLCKTTRDKFAAAVSAPSTLERVRRQKDEALGAIVLPTQCLCYKAATVLAGKLAMGELSRRFQGIFDKALDPKWLNLQGAKKVTEQAIAFVKGLLRKTVQDAIEQAAQGLGDFQSKCRQHLELKDVPILRDIDMLKTVESWTDLLPYVRDAKDLVAAGQELHDIVRIGIDFAAAHLAEVEAQEAFAAATDQTKIAWESIAQMAASKPGFEVTDVQSKSEPPPERPWYQLWPVRWPW